MGEAPHYTARLLISCPDRPGIVAAVSGFLFAQQANIVSSHQYSSDPSGGRFFLRTEFFLPEGRERAGLTEAFGEEVAERSRWTGSCAGGASVRRTAILVSRHDHCLLDLLWRRRRGELDTEIVAVISNHPDLERETLAAGVPFHHVPVAAGEGMGGAEERMVELLEGQAELLVLARYMQVLSGEFLERIAMPAINIHHSFLPAFPGADPYRRAHDRGVKLIGATAHYVTEQLDDGPIIDQDVVRVDHRQSAEELRAGRARRRAAGALARGLAASAGQGAAIRAPHDRLLSLQLRRPRLDSWAEPAPIDESGGALRGPLAQPAEQGPLKPKVPGSIPGRPILESTYKSPRVAVAPRAHRRPEPARAPPPPGRPLVLRRSLRAHAAPRGAPRRRRGQPPHRRSRRPRCRRA